MGEAGGSGQPGITQLSLPWHGKLGLWHRLVPPRHGRRPEELQEGRPGSKGASWLGCLPCSAPCMEGVTLLWVLRSHSWERPGTSLRPS